MAPKFQQFGEGSKQLQAVLSNAPNSHVKIEEYVE